MNADRPPWAPFTRTTCGFNPFASAATSMRPLKHCNVLLNPMPSRTILPSVAGFPSAIQRVDFGGQLNAGTFVRRGSFVMSIGVKTAL